MLRLEAERPYSTASPMITDPSGAQLTRVIPGSSRSSRRNSASCAEMIFDWTRT